MQSTLRPVRLTRASAPSRAAAQGPMVRASQGKCRHGPGAGAWRERMVMREPASARCWARERPMNPLPPAMRTWDGVMCGMLSVDLAGSLGA